MPFPDLDPKADTRGGDADGASTLWASATGVPDNGANVIGLPFVDNGVDPDQIQEDWMDVRIDANGPSITAANPVPGSLSADKKSFTVDFTQAGLDTATVTVNLIHTLVS